MRIYPLPRRRPLRLPTFSYGGPCTCFVTFGTIDRRPLLAEFRSGEHRLLAIGDLTDDALRSLARHRPVAESLGHVIMPDHVHAVLRVEAVASGALSRVVNGLKGAVTRGARREGLWGAGPLWARSFHDRVIRSEKELQAVQRYIADNPARWAVERVGG